MTTYSAALPSLLSPLTLRDMRVGAFVLSLVLYGCFGSPTPDHPGIIEAVVAVLLVFAVGAAGLKQGFLPAQYQSAKWTQALQVFLIFGLSVPLALAVFSGHGFNPVMRDVIAFLFLCLPLFLHDLLSAHRRSVLIGFVCLGVIFALRSFPGIAGSLLPAFMAGEALYYLANSPSVLFAAIVLFGAGVQFVMRWTGSGFVRGVILLALCCIPLMAMVASLQRASLGLFALSAMAIMLFRFRQMPVRSLPLLAVCGAAAMIFFPVLSDIVALLTAKTQSVGGNMRIQELAAVWNAISAHPLTLLFGLGWGADFQSPAVGMMHVHFTHSLLSAMLLKTGLAGLVLLIFYFTALIRVFIGRTLKGGLPISLFLALACPLFIDTFLYAAYKSYEFGVLLLLVALYGSGRSDAIKA